MKPIVPRAGDAHADAHRHPVLPADLLDGFIRLGFIRLGQTRSFAKGTIVVTEGEPAEVLYVVQEGWLRVFVADEQGREVQLNVLGPGEYVGEMMLDGHIRSASVKATTPVRLTMVRRADFEQILGERPDIAFQLIQSLIYRVRLLSRNVQGLVSLDVYGRIARMFGERATLVDGRRVVPGRLSQQKIADEVGASRSMVNRILKDLSEGGYISVSKAEVTLLRELPKRW
jgi:CRP/FNR family transcriptional regulator, cyclic AMP receptor protein